MIIFVASRKCYGGKHENSNGIPQEKVKVSKSTRLSPEAGGKEITMECRNCDYYKAKNCKHQCMFLPDGMTCGDCINIDWCSKVYGIKHQYTSCDFEPIRFKAKVKGSAENG